MRTEAANVLNLCLDHGLAGVARDELDTGIHSFTIEIDRPVVDTIVRQQDQRRGMKKGEGGFTGRLESGFWESIYLV